MYNLYMNSIPRNYLSKLDLRETQEAQEIIRNELLKAITNKLEFTLIRQPMISSERISTFNNEGDIKRPINFDSSSDNIVYFVYNRYRYWFTKTLKLLEVKNNNGIGSFLNYISRDEEITNVNSLEKNLFQIEIRYDNKKNVFQKGKDFSDILISSIREVETKLLTRFAKLKKTIPTNITTKDVSRIGTIVGAHSVIDELASDLGYFILENKRTKKQFQSINNNFEIQFFGYSSHINKAYEIFHIHDRKTIEDLEPMASESKVAMEEFAFAKEILNNEDLRSISISIDLDILSLALLSKSHILELQSGRNIEDIEKILISSDIKHL